MCGICGIVYSDPSKRVATAQIEDMLGTMVHRGPDDSGIHIDQNIGIGQRRLSIIDLDTGRQPLCNEDGSVWITFNGEIYNYQELRLGLVSRGHRFTTKSDTEVIVHLYEEYGESCLQKLRGMFAFGIWDCAQSKLFLARDRLGVKPLYYALTSSGLIFGSEVKPIITQTEIPKEPDRLALRLYLSFLYSPSERTLFKGVKKLRPGHYAIWREGKLTDRQYWDLAPYYGSRISGIRTSIEQLNSILDESVRLHLISDVPVGFLLSGGVDSSALLDIACRQNGGERLKCFTIGFAGEEFADERYYARLIANKLGLEHFQTTISGDEFFRELPSFIWHVEEPICEPPAVALHYVSKLAREHVKVVISGEGGDEAFAGYPNYRNNQWFELVKALLGPKSRHLLARFLSGVQNPRLKRYFDLLEIPLDLYYYSRTSSPAALLSRLSAELVPIEEDEPDEARTAEQIVREYFERVANVHPLNKMLYLDSVTWLPDDLLLKADKITMANSLELRVPLLDHVLLQFAASVAPGDKVHGFTTKYILKRAFKKRVPQEILKRRKTGFPVPYARWMTERSDVIWDVLTDPRTISRSYFDPLVYRSKVLDRLRHNPSLPKELFSLFILEIWARTFLDGESVTLI